MATYAASVLFLIALAPACANGATWKPSMCRRGREEGYSVVLEARCVPEGIEVTWSSVDPMVELLQVEYLCRNISQGEQVGERNILLANSYATSGSDILSIPWSIVPTECTISGCYEDGWFNRYAIAPTTYTCQETIQGDQLFKSDEITATTTVLPQSSSLEETRLPSKSLHSSTSTVFASAMPVPTPSSSSSSPSTLLTSPGAVSIVIQGTSDTTSSSDTNKIFTHTPTSTQFTAASATETVPPGAVSGALSTPLSSYTAASPSTVPLLVPHTGAVGSVFVLTVTTVVTVITVSLVACVVAFVMVIVLLVPRRQATVVEHMALSQLETKGGSELEIECGVAVAGTAITESGKSAGYY